MTYPTTEKSENFVHPDGSGFMFDLPPRQSIWGYTHYDEGDIYDVPTLPRFSQAGHWTGWTQWIEKWQKDYRFAAVTDYNAAAQPFPEVHDPWSFTEYVFEGTGRASDLDGAPAVGDQIIEPPLVDPTRVDRDTGEFGWPTTFRFANEKPATVVPQGEKALFEIDTQWESMATGQKFWQSQLAIMGWREDYYTDPDDPSTKAQNRQFKRLDVSRRVVTMKQPELNAGVRLYHQPVWSQSLRWGYSQNVPDRIINMTGPKEFFRPDGIFTGRIVPHVEIKSGTPVYDNLSEAAQGQQAVFWAQGITVGVFANDAAIRLQDVTPTGVAGPAESIFTYPTDGSAGTRVPLPKLLPSDVARYRFTELNFAAGDLVHRGCAFWEGVNGEARCRYYWENQAHFENADRRPVTHPTLCAMNAETGDPDQNRAAYAAAGGTCPFYTPQGPRVLTAYEGIARTEQQLNQLRRVLNRGFPAMSALPGLSGAVLGHIIQPPPTPTIEGRDPNDEYTRTRVEINYEPEVVPLQGKQTYHNTPDGLPANPRSPEDSLRVRAGTGAFPLDEQTGVPFGGVDTPFFGWVNQINYRVMRSVQHCYKASRCDKIITTRSDRTGWRRGQFSNINFTSHPLRMPGYPAIDGTDTECHYGDSFCPYNRLDRRAVEYDENYRVLIWEILRPFRLNGIDAFAQLGVVQGVLLDGALHLLPDDEVEAFLASNPTAILAAVRPEGGTPPLLGHWHPVVSGHRVFFYYTRHKLDPNHRKSAVAAHIIQFDNNDQPVYMQAPADRQAEFEAIYGTTPVPWLVELLDDYVSPTGNAMWATNAKPFWGGRSPEYKDHSKRGREILADYGWYSQTKVDDNTQSNQLGGVRWGAFKPEGKGTRGYWTDKDGEYIVKGTPGVGEPAYEWGDPSCVGVQPRIQNKPPILGDRYPINGVPGFTLKDPSNPQMNKSNSYASIAATYSNDTKQLLDWFHAKVWSSTYNKYVTNWFLLLPEDPMSDNDPPDKIGVAPPAGTGEMLPVERRYYRCPVCGLDAVEEEINFLRTVDKYAVTPGNAASQVKCPRMDGGIFATTGGMDRIPSSLARGFVDVWAPPGTTVRGDAMFWKNPPLITRAWETHISHKLGPYNPSGGGYTFQSLGSDVERLGRLPVPASKNTYDPGINRQMVMPLAQPGQSIAAIRTAVKDIFGLDVYADRGAQDVSILSRPGQPDAEVTNEATVTVQQHDTVRFERKYPNGNRAPVGILVSVNQFDGNAALLLEQIVADDSAKPDAGDYDLSLESEVQQYQADLREWVLNSVNNSITQWSSAVAGHKNLWASSLQAAGISPGFAQAFHPGDPPGSTNIGAGAGTLDIDERLIAPYAQTEEGGLKMLTRTQFQRLRNRILPMLAYDLSSDAYLYSAGGDYTTKRQAGNKQRFRTTRREIPQLRWATISPQVMAANDAGLDDYVEWADPELLMERGRAFYPTGTTWWRLNSRVGHIKRAGGTNPLHMDADPKVLPSHIYQQYRNDGMNPYTGNVVSTCTFFLHGRLPMDKELVRAYLVFTPDDGPSAGALGCIGKYDGYVGARARESYGFKDNIAPGTEEYQGNNECFWQHFHPWPTSHESDIGSYAGGDPEYWAVPGYGGVSSRRHWLEGANHDFGTPWYVGDGFVGQTAANAGRDLVVEGSRLDWSWRDDEEDQNRMYDISAQMLGMQFVDQSWGFGLSQGILGPWSFGQDLTQLMTEHQLWKEMTFNEYEAAIDKFSARVKASANTIGAQVTFNYIATPFRQKIYQRNHQGIAGWLNFENYDTSGRFPKTVEREETLIDMTWASGPQVIVQGGVDVVIPSEQATSIYPAGGGASGTGSAGNVARVLDVTAEMKRQYHERVTRYFNVKLGAAYDDLFDLVRGKTSTNITGPHPDELTENGLAKRFHTGSDYDPHYYWNYRYLHQAGGFDAGMWLNDPWHMPPLVNDEAVAANADGDPLVVTDEDRERRITDVTAWDGDFHPWLLCKSNTPDFDAGSGVGIRPIPSQASSDYWRVGAEKAGVNWFTVDLRQTPYELWRRPYRFDPPDVDASNATCPNVLGCWVAEQGLTVGTLYEQQSHRIFGGSTPNLSSSRCSVCGTPLQGVTYTDGDGITTVAYDPYEEPDAIVNGLEISVEATDEWNVAAKHGFVVEAFNSEAGRWSTLLHVDFNTVTSKYVYRTWTGNAWQWGEHDELPVMFRGAVSDQFGRPTTGTSMGAHFPATAAQKLRFKVIKPARVQRADPSVGSWGTPVEMLPGQKSFKVSALTDLPEKYVGRRVLLDNAGHTNERTYRIVEVDDSTPGAIVLHLDGAVSNDHSLYRIEWVEHVTRCSRFRAYGFPYRHGEVVMTPPGTRETFMLSEGAEEGRLPDQPSQILRVTCQAGDGPAIDLVPGTPNSPGWHWETELVNDGDMTYRRVVGGKYHYDHEQNSIQVPSTYLDASEAKSIWSLNADLYSAADPLLVDTLPSALHVDYFTGIGVAVECDIESVGDGPSYQLEQETICFLARNTQDDEAVPTEIESDVLPAIGASVPLKALDGETVNLDWRCYNHQITVWQGGMDWISGDELGAGEYGESAVTSFYTGGVGRRVSDLGPTAKIKGKCVGTVHVYGAPGIILSGKLAAYAKAVTKRQYHPLNGDPVITYERTGGFKEGVLFFRLEVEDTFTQGRKSVSCGIPKLLVWLRERDLTQPL